MGLIFCGEKILMNTKKNNILLLSLNLILLALVTSCGVLKPGYSPKEARGTSDLSIYETSIVAGEDSLKLTWSLNSETLQRMRLMGCLALEIAPATPATTATQTGTQEEANCKTLLVLNCTETNNCEKEENHMPFDFKWEWKKSGINSYVDYTIESEENPGFWSLLANPEVLKLHPWAGFWVRVESRDEVTVGKWVRVDSE